MDGYKRCPDCARENGNDGMRPLDEFFQVRAARYAGGVRVSAYCKRHTRIRKAATLRNAPEGSKLRESQRKAKREWAARNRAKIKENRTSWRVANPKKVAAANDRWRRKHPDVRKRSQDAYRERKKTRSPEQLLLGASCASFIEGQP